MLIHFFSTSVQQRGQETKNDTGSEGQHRDGSQLLIEKERTASLKQVCTGFGATRSADQVYFPWFGHIHVSEPDQL